MNARFGCKMPQWLHDAIKEAASKQALGMGAYARNALATAVRKDLGEQHED
jgi:hypothetical protein